MKDIKHIRQDFIWQLGHAPGVGLEGTGGSWGCQIFFSSKFNKILCASYLHESHMHQHHFFLVPTPWGLGEGPKGQISLNLNYNFNFKDF